MAFSPEEVAENAFLDGRVRCLQPVSGFRAGSDTVLLAAAVAAKSGDRVLELGCGAGVALCCLGARVEGVSLTGLELQADYADLARENLIRNGLKGAVLTGDVASPPEAVRAEAYDHVFFNPPYFRSDGGSPSADPGRDVAQRGAAPLVDAFFDLGLRRLRQGGRLSVILPSALLGAALAILESRAGGTTILPIAPREGRPAERVILRATKGSGAALKLLAPFVMHAGATHIADGDDHSDAARNILRAGVALPEP